MGLWCLPLLVLLVLGYASTYLIDYEILWYIAKAEANGQPITCVDLPDGVWQRVEKCWTLYDKGHQ